MNVKVGEKVYYPLRGGNGTIAREARVVSCGSADWVICMYRRLDRDELLDGEEPIIFREASRVFKSEESLLAWAAENPHADLNPGDHPPRHW